MLGLEGGGLNAAHTDTHTPILEFLKPSDEADTSVPPGVVCSHRTWRSFPDVSHVRVAGSL